MLEKIKKHKKLTIAIVVIVVIAIVIGILVHRMRQSASEITQVDSGIQAFTLQKQDMSNSVSTSGTVESSNVTEVTTEVSSAIKWKRDRYSVPLMMSRSASRSQT